MGWRSASVPVEARAFPLLLLLLLLLLPALQLSLATLSLPGAHGQSDYGEPAFSPWTCDNGTLTVSPGSVCDGVHDCQDKSDEAPVTCSTTFNCSETGRVTCPGVSSPVQCIWQWQACDGKVDCPGGTEESVALCTNYACVEGSSIQSQCPSGVGCTWGGFFCDGKEDCLDGSDEEPSFCASFNCTSFYKEWCPSAAGKASEQCIESVFMCDGRNDCPGGSEESKEFCLSFNCNDTGRVTCSSGVGCVNPWDFCNGTKECLDGSDEDPAFCSTFNCSNIGKDSCPTAPNQQPQCIPGFSLCDGFEHCATGSDEDAAFCSNYTCPWGSIKCPGTNICVLGTYCDGYPACPVSGNGTAGDEDPTFCKSYTCPAGTHKCSDGLTCISDYQMCNGVPDCQDESDEDLSTCSNYNCSDTGRVQCPSGNYCLTDYCSVCSDSNSTAMCPDSSDQWPSSCSLRNTSSCYPWGFPGSEGPGNFTGNFTGGAGDAGGLAPPASSVEPPTPDTAGSPVAFKGPSSHHQVTKGRYRLRRQRKNKLRKRVKRKVVRGRVRRVKRVWRKELTGSRHGSRKIFE